MRTPIIQFGTSRFLQAHIDLFIHDALENNKAAGYITVVQTTNNIKRAKRLNYLSKGYLVHIKGYKDQDLIDEKKNITSILRGLSTSHDWVNIKKIFIEEVKYVVSNTGDSGFNINNTDSKSEYNQSKSFPGKLLDLLYARYIENKKPLTIFPLELIKDNGKELKKIIIHLANIRKHQNEFISWLVKDVIWVNSLVDRIVSESLEPVGAIAEPYGLWAIENQPKLTLPCSHKCIFVVPRLEPYERLKLHILNLGHTVLADIWKRQNRSLNETVYEILNDKKIFNYLNNIYYEEVLPVFASKGLELEAGEYIKTTFKRFKNPFLKHCLKDIAQNHQDKISRRIEEFLQWSNSLENLTKKHKLQGIVDEKDHF
ncbi:D-mannonate oxidoreductase [Candidatus Woesearchaeota archaeon]|nr:D-mannonate oxidoreductase [Candidatus Woesearchaeota archaeon]